MTRIEDVKITTTASGDIKMIYIASGDYEIFTKEQWDEIMEDFRQNGYISF